MSVYSQLRSESSYHIVQIKRKMLQRHPSGRATYDRHPSDIRPPVRPSVRPSVRPTVRPSVCPSVRHNALRLPINSFVRCRFSIDPCFRQPAYPPVHPTVRPFYPSLPHDVIGFVRPTAECALLLATLLFKLAPTFCELLPNQLR